MRKVRIYKSMLEQAATNEEYRHALVLYLVMKRDFTNSIMYCYSIRKIMRICGCNYAKAIMALNAGVKCGLFKSIKTKNGDTHLLAVSIKKDERKIKKQPNSPTLELLTFSICKSNTNVGNYLFLYSPKKKPIDKYKNKKTKQTYKSVEDQILMAVMLLHIRRHNKYLDACVRHLLNASRVVEQGYKSSRGFGMKKEAWRIIQQHIEKLRFEGAVDALNRGISLKKFGLLFRAEGELGFGLGEYRVRKLLKRLTADLHISVSKNYIYPIILDMASDEFNIPDTDEQLNNPKLKVRCHYTLNKNHNNNKNLKLSDTELRFTLQLPNTYWCHTQAFQNGNFRNMVALFIKQRRERKHAA